MGGLLEFLSGYKLQQVAPGSFAFQAPIGSIQILGLIACVILAVLMLYRRTTVGTSSGLKTVLIVLKASALTVLLLCLLQPVLSTSTAQPQDSTIALVIDNSHSMTIRDMTRSRSRGELATDMVYAKGGMIEQLERDFAVSTFSFDRDTRPAGRAADLIFDGAGTDIAGALAYVRQATTAIRPAAVVLITDGAGSGSGDPVQAAGLLNSNDMPVYVIGIGSDRPKRDIEISRVSSSETAVEGGVFEVSVTVSSRGYEGRESDLLIESEERLVASRTIRHGPDGKPVRVTFQVKPEKEGALLYTARIAGRPDEVVVENNRMSFLVNHQRKQVDILYVEGHPRNEYKFIRRAAAADKAVRLKTYLQTGPQKYLRQDIDSPKELSAGYPADEAELFAYDAIIFGDIPRSFFSDAQLELTRQFVSRRGGGFLMIGGSTAFDENYIDTPIEDLLPVTLVRQSDLPAELRGGGRVGSHPTGRKFTPLLTPDGYRSAVLQLGPDADANRRLWLEMPQLQGINVTGRPKPGAAVLVAHPTLRFEERQLPVLAYQRYGKGRSMALMTASTWRWQMLMPHKDTSHEKLWRQVLRALAADTPSQIEVMLAGNRYGTGDAIDVRARLHDRRFDQINDADVWLKTTGPDGQIRDWQMSSDMARTGEYTTRFNPSDPGVYRLEVSSSDRSSRLQSESISILVSNSFHEYRNVNLNQELLQRIARAGGGRYYSAKSADRLVKDLERKRTTLTETVPIDVWDMPAVFLFLLACLGLEWMIRRRRGLS